MFKVMNLITSLSSMDESGQVRIYETGEEAAIAARNLSETTGEKWQPRRNDLDLDWREREAKRFTDKTYTKLPWYRRDFWKNSALLNEHFAHVSVLKSGMVAFTESSTQGELNKKVMLRPGRYLTRYFTGLDGKTVKELCYLFNATCETSNVLLFAETADDIEETYALGPESCMSNNEYRDKQGWGDFRSPFHPCRVYAAGDLQVAYMRDASGRITARSLVWPEKKTHSRIYGDTSKLSELLFMAGYRSKAPFGAKVLKIIPDGYKESVVLPYIDRGQTSGGGSLYASDIADDDKHLMLVEDVGDYECSQLTGIVKRLGRVSRDEESGVQCCDYCDDGTDLSDLFEVRTSNGSIRAWCGPCVNDQAFMCDGYNNFYANEVESVEVNGATWSFGFFERYGFICEGNGRCYHTDDRITLDDGTEWSLDYYGNHGFRCEKTGQHHRIEDMIQIDSGECVCKQWALSNGYGEDGKPMQLELMEIEEHERESA